MLNNFIFSSNQHPDINSTSHKSCLQNIGPPLYFCFSQRLLKINVFQNSNLAVNVETNSRQSERHGDRPENGEDGAEGDAQLASDELDLVTGEVDVEEEDQ